MRNLGVRWGDEKGNCQPGELGNAFQKELGLGGMLYQEQAFRTVARSIGRRRTSLMPGHVALGSGLWHVRA